MVRSGLAILGASSTDKGDQLEQLTATLLTRKGYRNVRTNMISVGGEEIDVAAEYVQPGIGGEQTRKALCECKAHRHAIALTDWLKFLGKVYEEEARSRQEVTGCFIALSGVNGNVAGSYDDLRRNRQNITLVEGDTLASEIAEVYHLAGIEPLADTLRRYTQRQYQTVETVYYDNAVYRVPIFEDGSFTILDARGDVLTPERLAALGPMVTTALEIDPCIDLLQEAEARERAASSQREIIVRLMLRDGLADAAALNAQDEHWSEGELSTAVDALIQRGWVVLGQQEGNIAFPLAKQDDFYPRMADMYRFLLVGPVNNRVFGCAYYDLHINEALVAQIRRIQADLPLSPEDVRQAVRFLKLSPGALVSALHEQPMIVVHRRSGIVPGNPVEVDKSDRDYFFAMLHHALVQDFSNSGLTRYLNKVRGLREVETTQAIRIKSATAVVLQASVQERIGVMEVAEQAIQEIGGEYVVVRLLSDAEQPWERPDPDRSEQDTQQGQSVGDRNGTDAVRSDESIATRSPDRRE